MRSIPVLFLIAVLSFVGYPLAESAEEKVTLTISRQVYPDRAKKFFDTALPAFNKENPNIEVKIIEVGGSWEAQFTSWIAAKKEPDIYLLYAFRIPDWVEAGALRPLDAYIDEKLKNEIPEPLWQANRWRGKTYGVPSSYGPFILFYNKRLFKEAGLDPNSPPADWTQFLNAAKRIREKTSAAGVGINAAPEPPIVDSMLPSVYHSMTNQPFLDERGKALFNTSKGIEAFEYWVDTYRKHKVTQPNPIEYKKGDVRLIFRDQKVGMVFEGPWLLPLLAAKHDMSSKESSPIGIALNPAGVVSSGTVHPEGWVVSANCKYPDAAWKLVRFLTRPEWQYQNDVIFAQVPVQKSEYAMPEFQKWYWQPLIKASNTGFPKMKSAKSGELYSLFYQYLHKALLGQMPTKAAVEELSAKVNELHGVK